MTTRQQTHETTSTSRPVAVRVATPQDATTVHTLVLEIAAHEDAIEHVRTAPDRWEELLRRDDVVVLVAERDGRVLGYASAVRQLHLWTGGDVLTVDDVYVRPGARDAGVGRRLLVEMASYADPRSLTITWGIEPGNVGAQRFYRRLGATLRDKVVARWGPDSYRPHLGVRTCAEPESPW